MSLSTHWTHHKQALTSMASTTVAPETVSAPSGAATGGDPSNPENPLDAVEKALQDAAQTLNTLALGVYDFTYDGQDALFSGVNQLVSDLAELKRAAAFVDARVPVDVLEAIDQGRNPELCTYDMLENCAESSAAARGKLDCMATFRAALDRAVLEQGGKVPSPEEIAAAQGPRDLPAVPPVEAEGGEGGAKDGEAPKVALGSDPTAGASSGDGKPAGMSGDQDVAMASGP